MKQLLFLLLILSADISQASKARLESLGRSPHLTDSQTVFRKPLDIFDLEPYLSLETGVASPIGVSDGAEGSVLFSPHPKSKVLFSLGHQDELIVSPRLFLNSMAGSAFVLPQNPVHVFYGYKDDDTNYVTSVSFSQFKDKLTNDSETSSELSAGVEMGNLQLFGTYIVANSAETGAFKLNAAGSGSASIFYSLDTTTVYFDWFIVRANGSVSGVENESHTIQTGELGLVDSKIKEERDYFWGGQVMTTKVDCHTRSSADCSGSFTRTRLPVWFGIEGQMENWLVMRVSITQSFLLDQIKDEVGYPASAVVGGNGAVSDIGAGSNSTVVGFGAGLKFGNLLVDGSFKAATSQTVNDNDFLTQSAMTYTF